MRARYRTGRLAGYQLSGADPERVCQRVDVVQRDVALAALHRADVCTMESSSLCERLLREPAHSALLTHAATEVAPPSNCLCL